MYYTTVQTMGSKKDTITEREEQKRRRLEEIERDFNAFHGGKPAIISGSTMVSGTYKSILPGGNINISPGYGAFMHTTLQTYSDEWVYLNPGSIVTCLDNNQEEFIVKFLILNDNGGRHDDETTPSTPYLMWLDYAHGDGAMNGYHFGQNIHSNAIHTGPSFEVLNEESIQDREEIIKRHKQDQEYQKQFLLNPSFMFASGAVLNNKIVPVTTYTTGAINVNGIAGNGGYVTVTTGQNSQILKTDNSGKLTWNPNNNNFVLDQEDNKFELDNFDEECMLI